MYAFFTARVCRETGCAVFVADYRLAPEFPFPAGAEDASAVYHELVALEYHARADLPRRGLRGRWAGQHAPARQSPSTSSRSDPAGLVLFSPEVDLRLDEKSVTENAEHDILPWNIPTAVVPARVRRHQPSVSPLTADLSGFPPTCVTWGGDEMFRDPIRRYVQRLRARRGPDRCPGVRGHVPRLPDPDAMGRRQPGRVPPSAAISSIESWWTPRRCATASLRRKLGPWQRH